MIFFLEIQKGRLAVFVGKFEHGFRTQLDAVLLWRRVRSGGLMLAAWSRQITAAGGRKGYIFFRNSEGAFGSFCG